MIVLSGDQMDALMTDLRLYVPKSLQVLAMLNNQRNEHRKLPGTEFVVDAYPDYSVCMSRPISTSPIFPWGAFQGVVIFCKNAEKLRAVLDQEDFLDWSLKIKFFAVSKLDVFPVVVEKCRRKLDAQTIARPDSIAHVFLLHPSYLEKTELPRGYRLGVLSPHHAEQVNEEWKYGNERTLEYVRYLISNGFPTSAVFTDEDELVAYILHHADGCMFNGFVRSNHRRKGLYQVVNHDLTEKVVALGQPAAWVYVMDSNQPSQNSYRKLGAKLVDPEVFCVDWIEYTPHKLMGK
ncbi:hypothetical protein RvY_07945 [Ramazzottius varieornatus]|uniref:Glycine N-acyltransferase-like protein n=1 Tax=Ramazzottius varieornatus TaxID=947166 RepID=A0A1D1V470_RAMVA|nr:hypothetical protein RvY_07945 [Ramazzottius varieornatus]